MTPDHKALFIVGLPVMVFLVGLFIKDVFFDDDEDEE